MSGTRTSAESASWSIAAAARATNLTQHTLRAWERRFGFPSPARLPSGHRRFTAEQVEHLKLIKRALDLGHRASAVVPLPVGRLLTMLPLAEGDQHSATQWCASTIELRRMFDLAAVADRLRGAAPVGLRPPSASPGTVPTFMSSRSSISFSFKDSSRKPCFVSKEISGASKHVLIAFAWPHQGSFKAIIKHDDWQHFPAHPTQLYRPGTTVEISGAITWYQGDPVIVVRNPQAIRHLMAESLGP